jgi:hypothetical protein
VAPPGRPLVVFLLSLCVIAISIYLFRETATTQSDLANSITNITFEMSGTAVGRASRQVAKTVFANEVSEGQGAKVRRSIGSAQLRNFSPFLLLDHFKVPGACALSLVRFVVSRSEPSIT